MRGLYDHIFDITNTNSFPTSSLNKEFKELVGNGHRSAHLLKHLFMVLNSMTDIRGGLRDRVLTAIQTHDFSTAADLMRVVYSKNHRKSNQSRAKIQSLHADLNNYATKLISRLKASDDVDNAAFVLENAKKALDDAAINAAIDADKKANDAAVSAGGYIDVEMRTHYANRFQSDLNLLMFSTMFANACGVDDDDVVTEFILNPKLKFLVDDFLSRIDANGWYKNARLPLIDRKSESFKVVFGNTAETAANDSEGYFKRLWSYLEKLHAVSESFRGSYKITDLKEDFVSSVDSKDYEKVITILRGIHNGIANAMQENCDFEIKFDPSIAVATPESEVEFIDNEFVVMFAKACGSRVGYIWEDLLWV